MAVTRDTLTGCALALLVTLILNAPLLRHLGQELRYPDITIESSDEVFYLGRIREVMDGHWAVGNSSIREYADQAYPVGILSEWLLGGFANATGLSLKAISLLGDFILPFLLVMLLWTGARPILPDWRWRAALIGIVFLGVHGAIIYWKRPVSPQMNTLFFYLWLGLFLHPRRNETRWTAARGVLTGLMIFSYPFHWTYALAAEALSFLMAKRKRALIFSVAFAPFFVGYLLLSVFSADPIAYEETLIRLGKISTHLPTGPIHQITLLGVLAIMMWTWIRGRVRAPLAAPLLGAGLIVFNLPILIGWEAEFSTHYAKIFTAPLWLSILWLGSVWIGRRWQAAVIAIAVLLIARTTWLVTAEEWAAFPQRALPHEQRIANAEIMAALNELPGQQVILTDDQLRRTMTLYTSHYPLFSSETKLSPARTGELIERAELQRMFVPDEPIDPRSLFGSHNVNAELHARQTCRLFSLLTLSSADCRKDPKDFLPPAWQQFLDAPPLSEADTLDRLRRFGVSYLLLQHDPPILNNKLADPKPLSGGYTLWTVKP